MVSTKSVITPKQTKISQKRMDVFVLAVSKIAISGKEKIHMKLLERTKNYMFVFQSKQTTFIGLIKSYHCPWCFEWTSTHNFTALINYANYWSCFKLQTLESVLLLKS